MRLKVLGSSIVVQAEHHNPSIMHPAFLKKEGIVPDEWAESGEGTVCTPGWSLVKFENCVSLTVDLQRLQVSDSGERDDWTHSELPAIVRKYVELLPHVRYKAVGINFDGIVERDDARSALIDLLLKPGPWNSEDLHPDSAAFRFVYALADSRFQVDLDAGEATEKHGAQPVAGIISSGNYQVELGPDRPVIQLVKFVDTYSDRLAHYQQTVARVLAEFAQ